MLTSALRFYWLLMPVLCLLLPINAPVEYWGETIFNSFFVVGVLRYCVTLHLAWLVDSAVVVWGIDPEDKTTADSNLVFILTKSFWPFYHYLLPWDFNSGEYGSYEDGFSTAMIKVWAALGWAFSLRTIDSEGVKKALHVAVDTGKDIKEQLLALPVHDKGQVSVLLGQVLVPPTPHLVSPVTRPLDASPHHGHGHGLELLGRLVVPGEHVVIVVPALAYSAYRHTQVLCRVDVPETARVSLHFTSHVPLVRSEGQPVGHNALTCRKTACRSQHSPVVRLTAPHVGGAVHQPGHVEGERVSEQGRDVPGVVPGLPPEVDREEGGGQEADDGYQEQIVPDRQTDIIILRPLYLF
uniref:Uncharacterized protein n=1 Tax=Timema cristinae TaxID=61476 RepID=A0A7R9D3R7_TIMCR|nr:unnamed protein product [Timema cristinae]